MDRVYSSIAPLSPFTWDDTESTSGGTSAANAALHDIALLDLRFDLILDEFAVPCHHPLHRINDGFPLRRKNLSLRQLQLLQYGVVVHADARLVVAGVPPCCGDSGACIAASYEHLFQRSLDVASAVAHHPLLPEYTFIVYRLPATVDGSNAQEPQQQRPEALFRFVYRNVNPYSSATLDAAGADFDVAAAPEFKLVAVLVSSTTYYGELQRVRQYRRDWYAHSATTRASGVEGVTAEPANTTAELDFDRSASHPLPEPVAAEVRRTSSLSQLCTCLAHVLERFTAVEAGGESGAENNFAAVGATTFGASNHGTDSVWNPNSAEGGVGASDEQQDAGEAGLSHQQTTSANDGSRRSSCDPWSYQYTRDGARLIERLAVVERTKAVLQSWRDGALDLMETAVTRPDSHGAAATCILGDHSTHPPLTMVPQRVPCARLLLLPSHHEFPTQVSENEIVSYLPNEEQSTAVSPSRGSGGFFGAVVYASPAAERLRRWILQGLVAAEVHGIHAVFLDLDPVSLLLPCVELLAEGEDGSEAEEEEQEGSSENGAAAPAADTARSSRARLRYKRALLLVCQVAVETVERFVRHSGLVWKATLAVRESSSDSNGGHSSSSGHRSAESSSSDGAAAAAAASTEVSFTAWCIGMLELLREAETQRELAALHNTLSFTDDDDRNTAAGNDAFVAQFSQRALVCGGKGALSDADNHLSASQQLALRTQDVVDRALTLYAHKAAGPAAPLPPHIVSKAKAVGVQVSDADLHSLFRTFCAAAKRRDQQLPVSALVDVLTEEWTADSNKRRRYSTASKRLVCPLDSCGVPVTRARVHRFLQPFLDVMRDGPLTYNASVAGGAANTPPQTLNYAQFSIIMFAIAKM